MVRLLCMQEVRNQLIIQKGYSDEELPTEETISKRLVDLGYSFPLVYFFLILMKLVMAIVMKGISSEIERFREYKGQS